jgi:hypothetical protein
MKFPITRERLQQYRSNEFLSNETEERINKVIDDICKSIERTIINTNERKYVYDIDSNIKANLRPTMGVVLPQQKSILNEVLERLKEKFLDCKILVDPLEKYILIDWS